MKVFVENDFHNVAKTINVGYQMSNLKARRIAKLHGCNQPGCQCITKIYTLGNEFNSNEYIWDYAYEQWFDVTPSHGRIEVNDF